MRVQARCRYCGRKVNFFGDICRDIDCERQDYASLTDDQKETYREAINLGASHHDAMDAAQ